MATAGTLVVNISANTGGLAKGAVSARATITALAQHVRSTASSFKLLAGAATAAAVAGIGLMVKNSLESIDSLAKTSDRLGIATEDLQALQHAAGLAGVSNEALEKSFAKLQKRLGEAAAGEKEASKAFAALGLNAKQLASGGSIAAFGAVADAIKNTTNQFDRVNKITDIFGKGAAELIPLLLGGSAALKESAAEAAALGANLTRVDAAKVEILNDQLSKLASFITNLVNHLVVGLSPILTVVVDKLLEFAQAAGVVNIVSHAFEAMEQVLVGMLNIFSQLLVKANEFFASVLRGAAGIKEFLGGDAGDLRALAGAFTAVAAAAANAPLGGRLRQALDDIDRRARDIAKIGGERQPELAVAAAEAKKSELKLPGAALFGSKEAASAIARFEVGGQLKRQEIELERKQLDALVQAIRLLRDINAKLPGLGVLNVP